MKAYDIAFDIGTTNLEANLIDIETGRIVSRGRLENPQSEYGADVVTRIERMQKKGRNALTDALLGGMKGLAETLLKGVRGPVPEADETAPEAEPAAIRTVAVSGNTILEHFAAGLDPSPIAVPPFTPETLFRENGPRKLAAFPDADVYFAPCVSGYVGGDIVSGMACLGLADVTELTLYVDIGTNGEIALGDRNGFLTCATAAGPAFGGAGMRGSDLIDAIADLLNGGKLMKSGRFAGKHIREHELTAETARGPKAVSRTTVHNLQLAKGAVRGGIETLLSVAGRSADELGHLIVAGDFGAKIDIENAKRIGLLPDIPTERIVQAGNMSLRGAGFLLTAKGRETALRTAERCRIVELSGDALFAEQFLKHINFNV